MKMTLARRMAAEFSGTLFLLVAVVGSGITGERLAAGNVAIALLANTLATGTAALVAIILAFGPISGAHLNPAVTLTDAWLGGIRWREIPAYILAQLAVGAYITAAYLVHRIYLIRQSGRDGGALGDKYFLRHQARRRARVRRPAVCRRIRSHTALQMADIVAQATDLCRE